MILTCPACGTSYVVKDGAIPPAGRKVRCASCKHSWHQDAGDGESVAKELAVASAPEAPSAVVPVVPAVVEPDAADAAVVEEPVAEPSPSDQSPPPVVVHAAFVEPEPDDENAAVDDAGWNDAGFDQPEPGRNRTLIRILLVVLLVAALAAAAWFFAPREWMARAGLAEASGDSPLKLMVTSQDRQKLASGNDLVSLSGRVINPTDSSQTVPALQADLRDGGGKLVYSWTIAPPAPRLPPRGSASFNAAELGVPANATSLTLRWAS